MLAIFFCLAGIFAILVASELLDQRKILTGDYKRKFIHILSASFIAFWPWLISWHTIAWIGMAMLLVVLLNHRVRVVDFHTNLRRHTYGDVFFALAVISSALIADQKVYFAIAMLILAYGDSLANLVGKRYGKKWTYQVFGHPKTLVGSMAMWLASIFVLGIGLLFANDTISYSAYIALVLLLPPILVVVENLSLMGFDNLVVPLVVLLALNAA